MTIDQFKAAIVNNAMRRLQINQTRGSDAQHRNHLRWRIGRKNKIIPGTNEHVRIPYHDYAAAIRPDRLNRPAPWHQWSDLLA
ncbi:hypothetical protein [Sphingobium psychrophilum]|uniref:hypothetical protein n=1 Tax=Sphingobium psychrophilum TaxID=2728834 RepID=UPI001F1C4B66|nr:hypothetical protein [Sphingobium psychrophilum]